jgi:hypothetical protein
MSWVYTTEYLLGAYGIVDIPRPFILDLCFGPTMTFDTQKIAFDKVDRSRRLAPVVSPVVEGKVMKSAGYTTEDFLPAYVKPKSVVDPSRPLARLPGERLLGSMTPEQRYQLAVANLLAEQERQITRREEFYAAQILLTGGLTVEGDDYPTQQISYGRNSSHTVQLTGANAWGQSGVSALANLRSWNQVAMQDSGYNCNVVILDPVAEQLFINDSGVQTILNNRVNTPTGADNSNFRIGNLNLAGVLAGAIGEEVKFLGQIGEFLVFVYNQLYTDGAGNVQSMLPAGTCILVSPSGIQGTKCYGAIQDPKAAWRALARFPKMWVEEDPAVTNLMTQSAPLPVAGWVNASFAANVVY